MKTKMSDRYTLSIKFRGSSVQISILNRATGAIQCEVIPILGDTEDLGQPSEAEVNDETPDSGEVKVEEADNNGN